MGFVNTTPYNLLTYTFMIIHIQVLNCLYMHFLSIHIEFKIFVLYLHFGLYAVWTSSTVYCLKKKQYNVAEIWASSSQFENNSLEWTKLSRCLPSHLRMEKDPVLEKLHSLMFHWNTRQCKESTNQAILHYYLYLIKCITSNSVSTGTGFHITQYFISCKG